MNQEVSLLDSRFRGNDVVTGFTLVAVMQHCCVNWQRLIGGDHAHAQR
jgi:hypothetical protein